MFIHNHVSIEFRKAYFSRDTSAADVVVPASKKIRRSLVEAIGEKFKGTMRL